MPTNKKMKFKTWLVRAMKHKGWYTIIKGSEKQIPDCSTLTLEQGIELYSDYQVNFKPVGKNTGKRSEAQFLAYLRKHYKFNLTEEYVKNNIRVLHRKYYHANKEKHQVRVKRWQQENYESCLKRSREWNRKNKDRVNKKRREKYAIKKEDKK
jgi:hypothetical protein